MRILAISTLAREAKASTLRVVAYGSQGTGLEFILDVLTRGSA